MTENVYVPFPDLEIFVQDNSLPLADVEDLASKYTVTTAAQVRLTFRWAGPAAGGPGWGGPEIAVIIVMGELLRRGTSEAYDLVKSFILEVYSRIRTRNAARSYTEGAFALAVDGGEEARVRLLFCFPEGLDKTSLSKRIRLVEQHSEQLLGEWIETLSRKAEGGWSGLAKVRLCWKEDLEKWVECQPKPEPEP